MDKFKSAIIEYEKARQMIIDLGTAIGAAGRSPLEWDGEICTGGKPLCLTVQGGFLNADTCIERYWEANKSAVDGDGYPVEAEKVPLCLSCTEVDRLIQERKKAKQQFGIAKRRITQIGKGLLTKGME